MRLFFIFYFLFCFNTVMAQSLFSVCFTPQQNCTARIVEVIRSAKHSIFMQAYMFTSSAIAAELVTAKRKGVKVELIVDKTQFQCEHFSVVGGLIKKGIVVWADVQPSIAHNKVIIVDHEIVETGSFNYTYSAQHKNAENVLIIHSVALAGQYMKNWQISKKRSLAVAGTGCQNKGNIERVR